MKKMYFLFVTLTVYLSISAQSPLIIDRRCIDITKIPPAWLEQAKTGLKIAYQHTSHGSQLVSGMDALASHNPANFAYAKTSWGFQSGVFFNDYGIEGASDLGHNGDLTWVEATNTLIENSAFDRNVIMWSWCGGCSDNTEAGINAYLNAMNTLETENTGITFVYMTGHLDGSGAEGNLNAMNSIIRNYCITNSKILFDFADIESTDPDTLSNYMEMYALDNTQYDSIGNHNPLSGPYWTRNWILNNSDSEYAEQTAACTNCAHSEDNPESMLNCVMKGRAAWWMFARIAGWDGLLNTENPEINRKCEVISNPNKGIFTLNFYTDTESDVCIKVYNAKGSIVRMQHLRALSPDYHQINIDIRNQNSGMYFYEIKGDSLSLNGKIMKY